MLGKQKCKILRDIRRRIAEENDIPYVTRDCPHQGDCAGTCPRCESELRYLEKQLAAREALGKRVAVAALCAGMSLSAAGCGPVDVVKAVLPEDDLSGAVAPYDEPTPTPTPEVFVTTGEVAWPENDPIGPGAGDDTIDAGLGGVMIEPPEGGLELSGDVAYDG